MTNSFDAYVSLLILGFEILLQIEFYFSDSNLFRDKFLMNLVKANADGFVELHTLCTFSRMQKLLDASPHGEHKMGEKTSKQNLPVVDVKEEHVEYVAQCLQDSDSLVLSEDNRHVRRADVSAPIFLLKLLIDFI